MVDDELARAVRSESAAAVQYWWGASSQAVKNWRRALDVDRVSNPGTNRLIRRSAQAGAEVVKAHVFTDDEREVRRWNAKRLNLGRYLIVGYHGP